MAWSWEGTGGTRDDGWTDGILKGYFSTRGTTRNEKENWQEAWRHGSQTGQSRAQLPIVARRHGVQRGALIGLSLEQTGGASNGRSQDPQQS